MIYKTILIPTDGSEMAAAAARAGIAFADDQLAHVIGLFVAPEYADPEYAEGLPTDSPVEDEYKASMRRKGDIYLSRMKEAAVAAGLPFSSVIVFSSNPAQAIVDTAENCNCDLIFMAAHGRGGWNPVLLGSVTLKVLTSCRIPVLVYRFEQVF